MRLYRKNSNGVHRFSNDGVLNDTPLLGIEFTTIRDFLDKFRNLWLYSAMLGRFGYALLTLVVGSAFFVGNVWAEDVELFSLLEDSSLAYLSPDLRNAVVADLETAFDERTKSIGIDMPASKDKTILMAMYFKRSDSITDELLLLVEQGKREKAYNYIKNDSGIPEFAEFFRKTDIKK